MFCRPAPPPAPILLPSHSPPLTRIDGQHVEPPTSTRADPRAAAPPLAEIDRPPRISTLSPPPLPPLHPAVPTLRSLGSPTMLPRSPLPNVPATSPPCADREHVAQPPAAAGLCSLLHMISGARIIEITVLVSK